MDCIKLSSVGELNISRNPMLSNIDGLFNINYVEQDLNIHFCDSLKGIQGLIGLDSVGGMLSIYENLALKNVDGLTNLKTTGGLAIGHNPSLENVNGLSNLVSIKEYLSINNNAELSDINGLFRLSTIGEDVWLFNNTKLENVDGLFNLLHVGNNFELKDNITLTNCCGIQHLLDEPDAIGGDIQISGNPSQCSGMDEILEVECMNPGIFGKVTFDDNDDGCDMHDVPYPSFSIDVLHANNRNRILSTINGIYRYPLRDTGVYQFVANYDTSKFEVTLKQSLFPYRRIHQI